MKWHEFFVPLQLLDFVNQFNDQVYWRGNDQPPTRYGVLRAIQAGNFALEEYNPDEPKGVNWHESRIAALAVHRWVHPITIDVNYHLLLLDGYHRLCAASFLGYKDIFVTANTTEGKLIEFLERMYHEYD